MSSPGFATTKRTEIAISAGFAARINVNLALASQTQAVTVLAEAPLLDTENTKVQDVFNATTMADLPTSRSMWSLMSVAPGLSLNRFDVGGSTMGTQTQYTSYGIQGQQRVQMDGVNMTEGQNATSAYTDFSAFEEVQMGTTQNDASMPSPGAQVNMVVKSGGNDFHGSVYQDYENSNFQGTNVSLAQQKQGAGKGAGITSYHDTNATLGGPIKRNKAWFFTSVRYQYIGTTITGFPANDPGNAPPFNTKLSNATYKINYQVNSNNKISQMLNMIRKQQPYRNSSATAYKDSVYSQEFPEWVGNLQWDSTLSPRAFLNVRAGAWGYNWTDSPYAGPDGVIDYRRYELQSGNTAGGFTPRSTFRRRIQFQPTLSYTVGSHFFTTGWLTEREWQIYGRYPFRDSVELRFASAPGQPDFTTPSQVRLYNTPARYSDYLMHHGAYVQDKWRISNNITLNLGIRWDYYNNYRPDEKVGSDVRFRDYFYAGVPFPNAQQFTLPATYPNFVIPGNSSLMKYSAAIAPRLGLAWDLFGNARTVIKLGYGRYYSNPSTSITARINPVNVIYATFGWNDLNGDKLFQMNELGDFKNSNGSALSTIDPNIRQPYMDDYSGFIEHQISRDLVIRAGFVYRKLAHDWANIELNRTPSLYTKQVTATDPGFGNVPANNFVVYDIPDGAAVPPSRTQWQTPNFNNTYTRNIDISLTKRMSSSWYMSASYLGTWGNSIYDSGAYQPNILKYNNISTSNGNFKFYLTYQGPWGLMLSPIYRFQLGQQLPRLLFVTGLNAGNITIPVQPTGSYRQNNISIFDFRIEKQTSFSDRYRLGLFFDLFNVGNSNAAQNQANTMGTRTALVDGTAYQYQRFLSPTTIISPRIFRIGAKFYF